MEIFLCALGIALILEGLPYFLMPEKLKEYFTRMQALPSNNLRVVGFIAMLVGLALIYWARH